MNRFENIDDKLANNNDLDADAHHFNDCFSQNLGYVDTDRLNNVMCSDMDNGMPTILHLNARNLVSNIDLFCASLKLLKNKFSIIAVSETWTGQSTENCIELPGYNKVVKSRQARRGGGLAIFTDSELNVTIKNRPDLDVQCPDVFESLFIQVSNLSTKDILVGAIYKPPNTSSEDFTKCMSLLLDNINKENRPTYLMEDYNIDLLKSNTTHTQLFLNQMLSSGFFPAIDRATRITDTSATLIDNIYTNVHHKSIKSYIWITDISDHLPVCATIPGKKIGHKLGPSHAMKRIYTENNMHNFKTKLSETDWTDVLTAPCTGTKYSHFINIIDTLHNKCFPLTKVKINPIKDSKPWITSTLLNSIKRKNNLYKQYLNNKSNETLGKYKKYKNKLTSILRLAEKNYFSNKLLEAKKQPIANMADY